MKLEDQVCSLELAKKLKELGVKQESYFHWTITKAPDMTWEVKNYISDIDYGNCSAFTVAELGEMLPWRFRGFVLRAVCNVLDKKEELKSWELAYWEEGHEDETRFEIIVADTEADARARMIIYLIENKFIDVHGTR